MPHITAQSANGLFFAQGYVMAQDRLWQMEMWRRAAEGRMAEVAGPGATARDRTARLLKYRGPFDDSEWTSYRPDGKRIFTNLLTMWADNEYFPLAFSQKAVTTAAAHRLTMRP